MTFRGIAPHLGLLIFASALAARAWTVPKDETPKKTALPQLWSGKPSDVQQIVFESKKMKVTLEAKDDEQGRYFTGLLDQEKGKAAKPPSAHGHAAPPPEPKEESSEPKEREQLRFIGVEKANELAAELAPLRALRSLGKIAEDRYEEFGFHEDEGKVDVTIGGKAYSLVLGGATPGGRDRYVRMPDSGDAYVVSGTVASSLSSAESKLVEQNLHKWPGDDAKSVAVIANGATRELVRHAEKKNYWANPATPEEKDETASNWMTKVERLRINKYEPTPEPAVAPEDLVVRVEFLGDAKKPLGYIELVRRKGEPNNEYLIKSEQSRWYGFVLRSVAEQVDQDVGSVVHP